MFLSYFFFFQAEDGIRDFHVTGVQTCALPIWIRPEVHDAHLRPNPRRPDDGRAGRLDARSGFSANPAVTRSVEPRPEFRAPVSRPPAAPVAAAPQARPGPGNVPRPAPPPADGRTPQRSEEHTSE